MEVLHSCCAGLDVHKETVVACVLDRDFQRQYERKPSRCWPWPT